MFGRIKVEFQGLVWTSRIRETKGSYFICIPKPLAKGNFLKKGDSLKQFVAKINNKIALITILDKEELLETVNIERNISMLKNKL